MSLYDEGRITLAVIRARKRIYELAQPLSPTRRAASLAVVKRGEVTLVDLVAFLRATIPSMPESTREAFLEEAGRSTTPNQIRALVVLEGGVMQFHTVELPQ